MHGMLRNLSEKLRAKFPSTTRGFSMVKTAHLYDAFSEFFELVASPRSVTETKRYKKKKKERKKII